MSSFDFTKLSNKEFENFVFDVARRVVSSEVKRELNSLNGVVDITHFGGMTDWRTGEAIQSGGIAIEVKGKSPRAWRSGLDQLLGDLSDKRVTHLVLAIPIEIPGRLPGTLPMVLTSNEYGFIQDAQGKAKALGVDLDVWDATVLSSFAEQYPGLLEPYQHQLSTKGTTETDKQFSSAEDFPQEIDLFQTRALELVRAQYGEPKPESSLSALGADFEASYLIDPVSIAFRPDLKLKSGQVGVDLVYLDEPQRLDELIGALDRLATINPLGLRYYVLITNFEANAEHREKFDRAMKRSIGIEGWDLLDANDLASSESEPSRVLFAKIGWADYYAGIEGDEPQGDVGHLKENTGYEHHNFKVQHGEVHGYFEPPGGNRIDLTRIEPGFEGDQMDEVLLVFVAPKPGGTGQQVVGWYERATLFAEPRGNPFDPNRREVAWTDAPNVVLLPKEKRFDIGAAEERKGKLGEADPFYLYEDAQPRDLSLPEYKWVEGVLEFISNYDGDNAIEVQNADALNTNYWFIRGLGGELIDEFLQRSVAMIGWPLGVDPKTFGEDRQALWDKVAEIYQQKDTTNRAISVWTKYLWQMVHEIKVGDKVVTITQQNGPYEYYIGEVNSEYQFREEENPDFPHTVGVHWNPTQVRRRLLSDEAKADLKQRATIFNISSETYGELNRITGGQPSPGPQKATQNVFRHKDSLVRQIHLSARNDDALSAKEEAKLMVDLLPQIKEPAVLGLFGQWGRGKTFFYEEMCRHFLEDRQSGTATSQQKYHWVKFNAWLYQDTPATWAFLYGELLREFLFERPQKEDLESPKWPVDFRYRKPFRVWSMLGKWTRLKVATFAGLGGLMLFAFIQLGAHAFLGQMVSAGWSGVVSVVLGVGAVSFIQIAGQARSLWAAAPGKLKPKSFGDILGIQSEIQEEMARMLKKWFPNPDREKLFLFIDDLDRCDEGKIISVIDAVRLMMEHSEIKERVVVMVGVDERILLQAVKLKYDTFLGSSKALGVSEEPTGATQAQKSMEQTRDILAREYLDKLFLFGIKLRPIETDEGESLINTFRAQVLSQDKEMENLVRTVKNAIERSDRSISSNELEKLVKQFEFVDQLKSLDSRDAKKVTKMRQELQSALNRSRPQEQGQSVNLKPTPLKENSKGDGLQFADVGHESRETDAESEGLSLPGLSLSQAEHDKLDECLSYLGDVTPRQLKSYFFKYLFGRNLLVDRAKQWEDFAEMLAISCNPTLKRFTGPLVVGLPADNPKELADTFKKQAGNSPPEVMLEVLNGGTLNPGIQKVLQTLVPY